MTTMTIDRRTKRSDDRREALELYLAAAAARGGIDAVALGDEDGFLVAGAGRDYDLGWLAAMGSAFAGRPEEHGALAALGEGLHAAPVPVGERVMYLAAVGGGLPPMGETAAALGRILTTRAA